MNRDGTLNIHLHQGDTASALATSAASPGGATVRGFGLPLPAPSGGPRSGGAAARRLSHPPGVGMSRLLSIAAVLGGLCGVAALLLGAVGLPVALTPPDLAARLYTQVSVHLWYLEMILLIVGLAIGVLGILGYQAIREAATTMARTEANRVVARQMKGLRTGRRRDLVDADDENPGSMTGKKA